MDWRSPGGNQASLSVFLEAVFWGSIQQIHLRVVLVSSWHAQALYAITGMSTIEVLLSKKGFMCKKDSDNYKLGSWATTLECHLGTKHLLATRERPSPFRKGGGRSRRCKQGVWAKEPLNGRQSPRPNKQCKMTSACGLPWIRCKRRAVWMGRGDPHGLEDGLRASGLVHPDQVLSCVCTNLLQDGRVPCWYGVGTGSSLKGCRPQTPRLGGMGSGGREF